MKNKEEKELIALVKQQKECLTIKLIGKTFWVHIGTSKRLAPGFELDLENAHSFNKNISNEFLKQPKNVQLMFIKALSAGRLCFGFLSSGNLKFSDIYERVFVELKEEIYSNKELSDEQKMLFTQLID